MGTDQSKSDGEHTNVEKEPDLVQILLALTILDSIAPDLEGSTVDSEKHAVCELLCVWWLNGSEPDLCAAVHRVTERSISGQEELFSTSK